MEKLKSTSTRPPNKADFERDRGSREKVAFGLTILVNWLHLCYTVARQSIGDAIQRLIYRCQLFMLLTCFLAVPLAAGQAWSAAGGGLFKDTDGNEMRLWYGVDKGWTGGSLPKSGVLDKPFIIIEGFDPENKATPEFYYNAATKFFDAARRAGADVLIVNFADGGADMLDNAAVVQRAIRFINGKKKGSTAVRVAGISMGGLIARIALATDSNLGVSHFVSLDAPHQGAVADKSLLKWVVYLPGRPWRLEARRRTRKLRTMLNTTAAKQMLVYNPYDKGERAAFVAALSDAGYPTATKNIGVAFSKSNYRNLIGSVRWLTIKVKIAGVPWKYWHFYMSADELIGKGGSYLPRSFTAFQGVIRRGNPTFVPHSSALDTGSSGFDVKLSTRSDGYHNEFPDELTYPILHWLDYTTGPLHVAAHGSIHLDEGEPGSWSVYKVGGGSGSYAFRWQHWFSCNDSDDGASGAGLNCNSWHSVGDGTSSYKVDSLSAKWSRHKIRVTLTDKIVGSLAPATSTVVVDVQKTNGNLERLAGAQEEGSTPVLEDNYPNPFNPSTAIRFTLPTDGQVTLQVYGMSGRAVATLANGYFGAGSHTVRFDGSSLATGTYYYTIRAAGFTATRSMLLVK